MKRLIPYAAVVLLLSTAACAPYARPMSDDAAARRVRVPEVETEGEIAVINAPVKRQTEVARTYAVGARRTVAAGEVVVGLRSRTTHERTHRAEILATFKAECTARPNPFSAPTAAPCKQAPLNELRGAPGEVWSVAGVVAGSDMRNPDYVLAKNTEGGTLYLVLDSAGYLRPGANVGWRPANAESAAEEGVSIALVKMKVPLSVSGPIASVTPERQVIAGASHENFDLIYVGMATGRTKGVKLQYREYSPFVKSSPIHTQDFVYRLRDGMFYFKNFAIRAHEVEADGMVFTVESDTSGPQ